MDKKGRSNWSAGDKCRMEESRREEWIVWRNSSDNSRCGEIERLVDADVMGEKRVKKRRVAVK